MALTYQDHADRAHRAAALVLTLPAPIGLDLVAVHRLHDDLALTLGEAVRLVVTSALGESQAERARAGIPAARAMLTRLESYPELAVDGAPDVPPSQRWSGRPADLAADLTPVGAWKVLAAETFLARSCLDQLGNRVTTPIRAAVLTDLAATADALATATSDLVQAPGVSGQDVVLGKARELAANARDLEREAAGAAGTRGSTPLPPVAASRELRRVHVVREVADVAPALANLARLTESGRPRVADLFATATMLGTVADAVASAMDTAGRSHPVDQRAELAASITTLTNFRSELSGLVRAHRPKLASLGPGDPAALAQAREIRNAGVPQLSAPSGDPSRADVLAKELRRIAAALAPATAAVRAGFEHLDGRGGMLAHDWAPGPGFHWRAATNVDAQPVLDRLDKATSALQTLRPETRADVPVRGRVRRSDGGILDLTEAIDRRRASLTAAEDARSARPAPRCAPSASLSIPADPLTAGAAPVPR